VYTVVSWRRFAKEGVMRGIVFLGNRKL